MIIRKKTREISNKHVDRKLIFRLRRFAIILLVISGVILYDILTDAIHLPLVLFGILIGFLTGVLMGKFANVHWHEETNKVVAKLDKAGIIILALYLCFTFSKRWIFGHWIQGTALSGLSFSIAIGTLTGRLLTIRKQVRGILREKGILPKKDQSM